PGRRLHRRPRWRILGRGGRVIALFTTVARGGATGVDPALAIEEGRLLVELERWPEARDRALAALAAGYDGPSALGLCLDASTGAGLGPMALVELVDRKAGPDPWSATSDSLASDLAVGNWKAVRADVDRLTATWPDAPDALAPLWSSAAPEAIRLREKAYAD